MPKKKLILIVGPTAVGKTTLSVEIAKKIKADVFSCDSRQFYREMSIGTAKPTLTEMDGVKHHFIDNLSITDKYSAGKFEEEALAALENYFEERNIAIMTGGSGLFVKAITHGFDALPAIPENIRKELNDDLENVGIEILQQELKEKDPLYYSKIDPYNPQRVLRALEIIRYTKGTFSHILTNNIEPRSFEIIKIGLELPREELYQRINHRVDQMINNGLMEEVKSLLPFKDSPALNTVGYKEIFDYFESQNDWNETVEMIKRNTRRFAKRQLTWFKNQDNFKWFSPSQDTEIEKFIEKEIGKF